MDHLERTRHMRVFLENHPPVCKELFWVIVDQLSVDENVHVVSADQVDLVERGVRAGGNWGQTNLVLHLLLLGELDLGDLRHPLHLHPRAEDLDLVRVHRRVGDQDLGVLHSLRLVHPDFLVQQETWMWKLSFTE